MMGQRIFITGITSFLLRDLATRLRDRGHTCVGLTRQSISIEGIELIRGDLMHPDAWRAQLNTCSMVIHGAAITHSHDERLYEQVNHLATRALVDACDEGQRFVFISSRVAGDHSGAYGVSKFRAEKYIRSHCPDHLILRPSEVFGGGKEEGIESLVKDVFQKRLVVYPGGVEAPLCPIHINDLVDQMEELVLLENYPEEALILRGPQCMGFSEVIQTISEAAEVRPMRMAIPEWMMRILAHVAKWFPGLLPFTADQVARLYAPKPIGTVDRPDMLTMAEYVRGLKAQD